MSASLGLFRLQQVDRKMDRARVQMESIRKTLENDTELRKALKAVENAQAEQYHKQNALKNAEAETRAQKVKIEQTESSLYGGGIHNPKELQDLQKDVASLKKHLIVLEERELEAMLAAETAENAFTAARSELEKVQSRAGSEQKKLLEDQALLTADLERLESERSAALTPIEASLIAVYEDLKKQKRGVAVAEYSDNACAACGSTVNAALQQNAKSSKQLAYCPTCGRILYVS